MSTNNSHPTRSTDREADERFFHLPGSDIPLGENGRVVNRVTAFSRVKDGVTYVAFAECDSRDQFCRRTGRNVARRKWFAGKRYPTSAKPSYDELVRQWEET